MRFLLCLVALTLPCSAIAQTQPKGADQTFPAKFAALLQKLTKAQAENMQTSANEYCRGLDYSSIGDFYNNLGHCTLMQSSAIIMVDSALSSLDMDEPTKYRISQVKKCWALYRALGSRDVENLEHCFGDIQYFELLQRNAGSSPTKPEAISSAYCDKVASAAGGSYMILEECQKQENASRRRVGQ